MRCRFKFFLSNRFEKTYFIALEWPLLIRMYVVGYDSARCSRFYTWGKGLYTAIALVAISMWIYGINAWSIWFLIKIKKHLASKSCI